MNRFTVIFGGTWIEDTKLTANDGSFNGYFGSSATIIIDTLLVGDSGNDNGKGSDHVFVLAGDGSWYEGTEIIPINGFASIYYFGYELDLYGNRDLIEAYIRYEKGDGGGVC